MSKELLQRAITLALDRRTGHGTEAQAKGLEEAFDAVFDWTATCPSCGARLKGSRKELRAHDCSRK